MMPPHCKLCRKTSRSHPDETFELVRFKLTDEERAKKAEMKARRRVGHPPGTHWFCSSHAKIANQFKQLTWAEALPKIKNADNVFVQFWSWIKSL